MNYEETIHYLYNIPMFEKQGKEGYKEGLDNTLAFDEKYGHPHRKYKTIHVAGTNGKGSVSHTLAAILQSSGYKVGLYTSPHLVSFRERIRINGEMIDEDYVVRFVADNHNFIESVHPSFFEVVTAMAFNYFADKEVDFAVIEVGLGGRLDCTNIITPILSVITNISFDHTQFLGDTLAKIAAEKAGIMKPGVPVVIGETTPETHPVFADKAKEVGCPIYFAENEQLLEDVSANDKGGLTFFMKDAGWVDAQLGGLCQEKNANTILWAAKILFNTIHNSLVYAIYGDEERVTSVINGFEHVCDLTGLRGRWERLHERPTVVCDTGHNLGGWQYISQQLKMQQCDTMRIVFGMVNDKDINGVLSLLPKDATYYFTQANSHRAIPSEKVAEAAAAHGLEGTTFTSVKEAYKAALAEAQPTDFIFVGGSTYIVADLLS